MLFRSYIETLTGIIRDLAAHGDVLIIGRGSQIILRDWPGAFHALLVAPLDHRIDFIAGRDGLSREDAAKRVHEGDKGRVDFHRRFFKVDVNDPSLYHLTVNSARFSLEECAGVVVEAARGVAARPQSS